MSSRRHSLPALVWAVSAVLLISILGVAREILHHALGQAAAAVVIAVGAYALGRRRGRESHGRDCRPVSERAAGELARLRAVVEDLEDVAGRPVAAIMASCRHIHRQYRGGGDRP